MYPLDPSDKPVTGQSTSYGDAQSEEITAKERHHLQIFATTGHETLKAFLFTSAGSVMVFLTFLGTILASPELQKSFGPASISYFMNALLFFIGSVGTSMGSYAFSFISHGCYFKASEKRARGKNASEKPGDFWTLLACIAAVAGISFILCGGYMAYEGLRASAILQKAV